MRLSRANRASLAAGVTPLIFWLQDGADRISWVRGAETAGVDAFLAHRRPGWVGR